MSGILDKKKRFIDFVVTQQGKRKFAENNFSPSFVSLTDKDSIYDEEKAKSIAAASDYARLSLETPFRQTTDVIIHEFDDSGKLLVYDIEGTSIVGDKIFVDSNSTTDLKKIIATGSIFASNNAITDASIKRFKRNKFIRTTDAYEEDNTSFEIFPEKHTFVMSNSTPFPKGPLTEGIDIDNAEPLMFDDKLSHFGNFQYLTPKNKDGSNIATYEDLRGTSKKTFKDIKDGLRIKNIPESFFDQNDTVTNNISINKDESLKILNRAPLQELSTIISKEHVSINFKKSSYQNNVILQIYEKNFTKSEILKLDIVDAGEFFDNENTSDKRPRKHVYYVGKLLKDNKDYSTFINLFTLIWD